MLRLILMMSLSVVALPVHASELVYKWKKGDAHTFHYESQTKMTISLGAAPGMDMAQGMMGAMGVPQAGGGNLDSSFDVSCDFTEKILKVAANGTANAEITVKKLTIRSGAETIDVTAKLPKAATAVKAEVDKKGHAKFFKMVTVYVEEDGALSVALRGKRKGPLGAEATATTSDGEEVTVFASIDPKTGTVSGGATHKKAAPKAKKLKAKQEQQADTSVDALPKEIFEMMELPDGDVNAGSRVEQKHPFGSVTVSVGEFEGTIAPINFAMDANVDTAKMTPPPEVEDDNEESRATMATAATTTKMSFQGTLRFDMQKGTLEGSSGTSGTDMSAGGVKVKTDTTFKLERKS